MGSIILASEDTVYKLVYCKFFYDLRLVRAFTGVGYCPKRSGFERYLRGVMLNFRLNARLR